jgi:tetratricopeptide (TPR) repeat protein
VKRHLPYRYNQRVVKSASLFVIPVVLISLLCPMLYAQDDAASARKPSDKKVPGQNMPGQTLVVIPFENISSAPGLEWLGESFPETFHEQLNSPVLYVASRNERLRAYDRQGIPASIHPTRATLYRLAEQMDVDYAVLGSYHCDGAHLTATAQLLDMRAQKLLPIITETSPLTELATLQSALAWDLLHQIRADFSQPKEKYVAEASPMHLDAAENYLKGVLASSTEEKIQRYRDAVRLNPGYAQAWLELGKTYYAQHDYESAIAALSQVQQSASPSGSISASISGATAREANFYLGLAAYAHGDFAKSESSFEFVVARVPLAEVYNNLGVVAARRGQKKSTEYFEKAIQNDPSDPDYHFNLAVALAESGDRGTAARELRETLDQHPNDAEAKMLLNSVTSPGGSIVEANSSTKIPLERIKHNYEEDAFRQMTTQMGNWAEQRFARSDPRAHARFHVELGNELLAHGFTAEALHEFQHAAEVDPSSSAPRTALAEDYEASGDVAKALAEAEASLRIRESAEAYLVLARLDLKANRTESAAQNIDRALQLEPSNPAVQDFKRTLAAKLAEKAQPLSQP